jgi:hypothetical protein
MVGWWDKRLNKERFHLSCVSCIPFYGTYTIITDLGRGTQILHNCNHVTQSAGHISQHSPSRFIHLTNARLHTRLEWCAPRYDSMVLDNATCMVHSVAQWPDSALHIRSSNASPCTETAQLSAKLVPTLVDRWCHRNGFPRPYSRFCRPELLLFLSRSSSFVLTRLSGPRSRPTSGSAGNRTRDLWICIQELWPLDQRGGLDEEHKENRFPLHINLKERYKKEYKGKEQRRE